ncbi:hypothetical protein K458DRAFT_471108 [Lentithecium fluviatile CBS 122367]|uniref:Rhodopsin domain-containing protein n=1 Tax=Lentithecium fluviatile CBS 122367 TaxID=1168545 RepID=A0A6G1IC99_9PLEO|nr:hypothetical protein K458DRAFT_471108 [Lentithecium fluviatile CBS 122367]
MAVTQVPVTPREKAQQDACTGVATAFTIVSILVVAARMFTRTYIVNNMGKDDWAMLAALVFTIAYLAAIYVLRDNGMGFSGKKLTLEQMEILIKTTLAIEIMYYVLVFCVKLSILFCYLRIAVVKSFERMTKATIYFLSVFCVICVIVCLAQCRPLHKMWDLTGLVQGTCINTTAFFYTTSAINILTDIWIITLPIPTLLRIQRPNHEKFGLIVVFSLGVFSCIASIVRLHSIRIYTESPDPFYDSVPVNLWSMVEVNIGIWCASIPALKALVTRGRSNTGTNARSRAYQYHSKDRSH